ncbi:MAG: hypothetical protein D6718_01490 [Acidobacteria bacterium]|nr:MAG: hypothetical protein D6718_01490 [Acidobacteriota bacterium]
MDRPDVYDLGEIRRAVRPGSAAASRGVADPTGTGWGVRRPGRTPAEGSRLRRPSREAGATAAAETLRMAIRRAAAASSAACPGLGHLAAGRWRAGLFLSTHTALCVAVARAVWCEPRLLAGTPSWTGPLLVAAAAVGAAGLHVAGLATLPRLPGAPPPPLSAAASALIPGWGQALNGCRIRAALFATCAWAAAAAWLSVSPAAGLLFARFGAVPPSWLGALGAAPLRWALPAACWPVAVYDAAAGAAARRRAGRTSLTSGPAPARERGGRAPAAPRA